MRQVTFEENRLQMARGMEQTLFGILMSIITNSVLTLKRKKRKSVWIVAFEDLDGLKLEEEHLRIVKELHG